MTAITGNYVCDNSTLANFKSWAQAISNALSTLGWVQTADTGQVNWASIASVPASTYVYEIWKANDALAATMPIYIKIEYGFSATSPRIRVTVGTGSSGAGVINGVVISSAPQQITNNLTNSGSGTTYPCFFSGDSGEFRMWMWGGPAGGPDGTLFGVERSKDSAGANTNEYVTAFCANQPSAAFGMQQSFTTVDVGTRATGIQGLGVSESTGLAFGTVAAFPVFPILGKVGNPMLGLATCVAADVTTNSIVTVANMYGATHTYVGIAGGAISGHVGERSANGAAMGILMRYE